MTDRASSRVCIVVPCYNEESRLDEAAFAQFLQRDRLGVELLFVNDGSTDRTLEVLRGLERRFPNRVRVIDQQPNQGKAEAVRVGMLAALATGADYAGYFDADLATPLDAIGDFVHVLDTTPGVNFVIGARVALLGRTIERQAWRHYLGRVFATAASLVLSLPVYDTQCGAKLLRAGPASRQLFEREFGSRWIFDVELIARYLVANRSSDGIYELPVSRWKDVGESKVKARDFVRAFSEMAEVYRTYFLPQRRETWLALLTSPLLRYAAAGAAGTAAHYLLLIFLVEWRGVQPSVAAIGGAVLGAIVNYALNYHVAFATKASHRQTLPKFAVVGMLSAALNGSIVWLFTQVAHLHYLLAQVIATCCVLLVGYALNRTWTFADRGVSRAAPSTERRTPAASR
jgi:putative flippase GtrA